MEVACSCECMLELECVVKVCLVCAREAWVEDVGLLERAEEANLELEVCTSEVMTVVVAVVGGGGDGDRDHSNGDARGDVRLICEGDGVES